MKWARSKRYGGKRTRSIRMSFQSFFDLSTQDGQMQIISVNAGGKSVVDRLKPFFGAYKYYKLGAVSFKLVPASTLPIDPSGLSYEENEPGVDPRDQLTPGMCRITNGEDILEDITGFSTEIQHKLYDNMILDPRWYKFMLQSGMKRTAVPKYWQIGQLHQDRFPGATTNLPVFLTSSVPGVEGSTVIREDYENIQNITQLVVGGSYGYNRLDGSSRLGIFQTGRKGRLGWMPTDSYQHYYPADSLGVDDFSSPNIADVPEIELFKILLPPARKTRYYYRAFVTETVYFREPKIVNANEYNPIDVFTITRLNPAKPGAADNQPAVGGENDGSD